METACPCILLTYLFSDLQYDLDISNVSFYKKKIMNHPVLRNRISMDHPVLHNRGTLVHFEAKQNEPPVKIEYAS